MLGPHILHAFALDGPDRGPLTDEARLDAVLEADTLGWVHLDGTQAATERWITEHLDYLDPQAIEALLDPDTRPRASVMADGVMLILRTINTNADEDPDDMVSIRVWADARRIITISLRDADPVRRLGRDIGNGVGPTTAGAFLVDLVELVTEAIGEFQKALDVDAEALELRTVAGYERSLRSEIVDLRLKVIAARRFVGPQREALRRIVEADCPVIDEETRRELEEEFLRTTRIVEDLDELRDQAMVLREELSGQLSDRLNRNMFVLSVISAIFLPLGFLTGLFGVNVGGMPGVSDSDAFLWLCVWLGGVLAVQIFILWWMRWLGRMSRRN